MRVRFWDLNYPSNSFIMAGAAGDPTQQTAVSYRLVNQNLTLLHSERPKLFTILAFLGAIGLKTVLFPVYTTDLTENV